MEKAVEIDEILQQAEDELYDASVLLGSKKPSLNMAFYHLEQFVEKIVSAAYAQMFMDGDNLKPCAKLGRILEKFPEIAQAAAEVETLLSYGTPSKNGKTDLQPEKVIKSVIDLREFFYGRLQREAPPLELKIPQEDASRDFPETGDKDRGDDRNPRPQQYVKNYYFCAQCGVKVPLTKQTYRGTTCPFCNRQLVLKHG
ncbi:MAG: hypothetical protein FJ088_10530 [Deltaproteobacteria bacterium]|nr:hypothetical protein [Deltaproteobacteria bacterium]